MVSDYPVYQLHYGYIVYFCPNLTISLNASIHPHPNQLVLIANKQIIFKIFLSKNVAIAQKNHLVKKKIRSYQTIFHYLQSCKGLF